MDLLGCHNILTWLIDVFDLDSEGVRFICSPVVPSELNGDFDRIPFLPFHSVVHCLMAISGRVVVV